MALNKQFHAEIKALTPEEGGNPGEFSAIVAVYNNVDSVGDRIKSGAFDETLEAWRKSGDPIPIVLAHEWNDPWAHIGYADPKDVESIPGRGLFVKRGVLDIDDNPVARQVYRLMQRRTLKEFSFGYRVADGGERKAADGAYDLTQLDLIEFGPCLKGVNPSTELLAVKAELEAGRRKSAAPTLEERLTRIEAALSELTSKAEATITEEDEAVEAADEPENTTSTAVVTEEAASHDGAAPSENPGADYELLLREQALAAMEVEIADVIEADHGLDDLTRQLDADEADLGADE